MKTQIGKKGTRKFHFPKRMKGRRGGKMRGGRY
jgi:hypothetical protein